MKSSVKYICIADTETGGLPSKENSAFFNIALCEVALAVIDTEELSIVDTYSAMIKPYKSDLIYQEQATAIHGLTLSILERDGESIETVYKDVKKFLNTYKNKCVGTVLGGHNFVGFDLPFFAGLFSYNNDDINNYCRWYEDTQKLAYYAFADSMNYQLSTCCDNVGVDLVDGHRALTDTENNALLMIEFLKRLRGGGTTENKEEYSNKFRETFII